MTTYVLCKTGSLAVFKVTARHQGHFKGPSGAFVTYCNISCFLCVPCVQRIFIQNILYSLQLALCRVAIKKRLPVHHHSADYIVWPFGIIGLILSQFVNRVPLKPVPGSVGSVAPLHYCT